MGHLRRCGADPGLVGRHRRGRRLPQRRSSRSPWSPAAASTPWTRRRGVRLRRRAPGRGLAVRDQGEGGPQHQCRRRLGVDSATLYASTGRGDLVALDAARGALRWRQGLGTPARSAPTIADGRLFVTTIEEQIVALAAEDGKKLWSYQATAAQTRAWASRRPPIATGWWWPASAPATSSRCARTAAGRLDRQPRRGRRARQHGRLLGDPRHAGDRQPSASTRSAWAG